MENYECAEEFFKVEITDLQAEVAALTKKVKELESIIKVMLNGQET